MGNPNAPDNPILCSTKDKPNDRDDATGEDTPSFKKESSN